MAGILSLQQPRKVGNEAKLMPPRCMMQEVIFPTHYWDAGQIYIITWEV